MKTEKQEASSPDTAASDTPKTESEKLAKLGTKKMYYLSCLACRWTSRDVGLPDQSNGEEKKSSKAKD